MRENFHLDDYFLRVARGFVQNHEAVLIRGRNTDVDQAAEEDIWEGGNGLSYLTTARIINLASDSAADTLAGTGAQIIKVTGITGAYAKVSENVNMAGLSDAATTNSYLRVLELECIQAGSGQTNAGTITATAAVDASLQCGITPNRGISFNSHYTVPADHTLYIYGAHFNVTKATGGGTPEISLRGLGRFLGNNANAPWLELFDEELDAGNANSLDYDFKIPYKMPEKTDIRIAASTSLDNTDIRSRVYGVLINNADIDQD